LGSTSVFPHLGSAVFRAASDHVVQQTNVITPGDVAHPVCMLPNLSALRYFRPVHELPKVDNAVVASADQSLDRWLKLILHVSAYVSRSLRCCLHQNCWLSRWAPTQAIDCLFVSNKVSSLPRVVLSMREDVNCSLSCACCKNETVLPRCPRNAID
jgi:hypothetical protein